MKLTEERHFILRTEFIRTNLLAFLKSIELPMVEVIIRPWVEKRSNEQNARLWALHSLAAKHTGHSAEEMHEFALMRHFGVHEIEVGDLVRRIPLKRSSQRNKREFMEFMEATEAWYISEFGVWLDQDAA